MAPPGAASSEPARTPGHHWSRRGPPRSRWSWVVVPPKGACRGPRSSALPSHSPGARPARPAGRAPEPPRGRAGSSPRAPVISTSPESICSNRPSRAPVSRNRRATSRPSTGLFLSSVALNRRQSFHQGLHRPLNTPLQGPATSLPRPRHHHHDHGRRPRHHHTLARILTRILVRKAH